MILIYLQKMLKSYCSNIIIRFSNKMYKKNLLSLLQILFNTLLYFSSRKPVIQIRLFCKITIVLISRLLTIEIIIYEIIIYDYYLAYFLITSRSSFFHIIFRGKNFAIQPKKNNLCSLLYWLS